MRKRTKKLVLSALFLALALVLPFLTGQIKQIGRMLCPMHYPVLLCGLLCGSPWGIVVGMIAPLMRSLIFGMPLLFPDAVAMAFELAAYGAISGIMYRRLPKKPWALYLSLITAMVGGRLVWGAVRFAMLGLFNTEFSLSLFLGGAVLSSWPSIVMQIVIIPIIVLLLKRYKAIDDLNE